MGEGAHEKTLYPFQSTLLMRGATSMRSIRPEPNLYFNPRSSCEERLYICRLCANRARFQSTLLMRGATVRYYHLQKIV